MTDLDANSGTTEQVPNRSRGHKGTSIECPVCGGRVDERSTYKIAKAIEAKRRECYWSDSKQRQTELEGEIADLMRALRRAARNGSGLAEVRPAGQGTSGVR